MLTQRKDTKALTTKKKSSSSNNNNKNAIEIQASPMKSKPESEPEPINYRNANETEWSPLMDGIIKVSPQVAVNEKTLKALDDHINNVLYGSRRTKRLSVFEDICPE
ncbi:hypothetical protein LguiA_003300 [Lonicera macranthoides]